MAKVPNLVEALVAMLDAAFLAHMEARLARREGRRSARAEGDLRMWLEEIVPGVLLGAEGVDGRLVWGLAVMALTRLHPVLERRFAAERGLPRDAMRGSFVVFAAALATSEAGLTWTWADTRPAERYRQRVS